MRPLTAFKASRVYGSAVTQSRKVAPRAEFLLAKEEQAQKRRLGEEGEHPLHRQRDADDAPGVGTPVRGGATYREAHLAMEIIADHGRMLSFEIVEVNPVIDEHNRTADLAVELSLSAFGKKIL